MTQGRASSSHCSLVVSSLGWGLGAPVSPDLWSQVKQEKEGMEGLWEGCGPLPWLLSPPVPSKSRPRPCPYPPTALAHICFQLPNHSDTTTFMFLALMSHDPFPPARHKAPGGQALPRPLWDPAQVPEWGPWILGLEVPIHTRLRPDVGAGVMGPNPGEKSARTAGAPVQPSSYPRQGHSSFRG